MTLPRPAVISDGLLRTKAEQTATEHNWREACDLGRSLRPDQIAVTPAHQRKSVCEEQPAPQIGLRARLVPILLHFTAGQIKSHPRIVHNGTHDYARKMKMATKLELEEYLYRRAIDIIESADSDLDKENFLFQEVWLPLADLYKDKITAPEPE